MIYSLTVTNTIGESLTFELSNPWASGYAIKTIDGLGTPDMNVNTTPYGIGDGSVLGSIKAEYRLITIVLYPLALPTVETTRQRLYRFFQIKKDILLTFNTENRLVNIDGYVQKIEANIFDNPESVSIEVKCINPYFHKMATDQTKFYGIAPKFEFPFSVEFTYKGGAEWTQESLPASGDWGPIVSGNRSYLSLNRNDSSIISTKDGKNWKKSALPSLGSCGGITYGDERFVAVFQFSSSIAYSISGETWAQNGISDFLFFPIIAYGNGRFLIVQNGMSNGLYSDDLVTWEPMTVPFDAGCSFVSHIGDYFVIANGSSVAFSPDGLKWKEAEIPFSENWDSVYSVGDLLIIFPRSSKNAIYTSDGVNWNPLVLPFSAFQFSMAYDGEKVLVVSNDGKAAFSSDLVNWTEAENLPSSKVWSVASYIGDRFTVLSDDILAWNIPIAIDTIDLIEFSEFTIDNRMTIEYEGEVDAGIRITIECQSPPGDIIIYNVDTLEYIQIFAARVEAASGAPLGPKDIIEINTESGNKYVRLLRNGIYYNILGAMNRGMTWFILKQGPNTFTYTTTDEHAAISMTFSYRDTYAAI